MHFILEGNKICFPLAKETHNNIIRLVGEKNYKEISCNKSKLYATQSSDF